MSLAEENIFDSIKFSDKELESDNKGEPSGKPTGYVKCLICGNKMLQVTQSHLKVYHDITFKEYKVKYPNYKVDQIVYESKTVNPEGCGDGELEGEQVGKIESLEPVENVSDGDNGGSSGESVVVVLTDKHGQSPLAPPDSITDNEKDTSKNNTNLPIEGALPLAVQRIIKHPPGTEVDHNNKRVLRDERGRILAGSGAINEHGRLNPLQKYLKERYGDASELIIKELDKIAFYDQIKSRHKWAQYKSSDKLKALEMLLDRSEGKPRQHIDASVEQKVVQINVDVPPDAEIEDIN